MDFITALGGGMLAGIGLAAPLGAIGVLLVREGLTNGFKEAAPAAAAVALIDASYCALAVMAGGLVAPTITSWGNVPAITGGFVLIALGFHGMYRTSTSVSAGEGASAPSKWRRFGLFAGLTAVNPATLVYFAALTLGLGSVLSSPAGPVTFIAGVAFASLTWQLGLVFTGSFFRGHVTVKAQRLLSMAGNAVIVALGLAAIISVSFGSQR
ncbi:LysE family transporter [Paenarthrobacter sp. NPDC056912]|uniref:LysE family transporter n=1 Tax=Paenarthrobacter sp. NPDC056912 TaxID=3345965 RepID=UPI00366CE58E